MSVEALIKPFGRKAHDFVMREPQYDKKHTLLIGSVRSSKTFAVDAKTIVQLSRYELPPNAKRVMSGATKQTFQRNVLLDLASIVGKQNFHYNSANGELQLFDKQWFVIGAKDEASYKQVLGSTIGLWVGDEVVEYPESFMAQMWMRMSPRGARSYLTCNPGNPHQYLKKDVLDNEKFRDRMEVIHFKLDDNPNIAPEDKADIIASQRGVFKLRYIDGLWVVAEGSIYKDAWDEVENCCGNASRKMPDGRVIPQEPIWLKNPGGYVDRYYAVDPGVDHPQVTIEFYDTGDVVYATREDVWDSRKTMVQRTDGQYASALLKFMASPNDQVLVPPEAASYKAELISRGIWVTDADNAVNDGIHTVSTMLARRKLVINVDMCPRLAASIPVYSWDAKAAKLGDEQPAKKFDDEVDALRYGLHGKVPRWRLVAEGPGGK
jgi:PBSX family phage terminase large subunit